MIWGKHSSLDMLRTIPNTHRYIRQPHGIKIAVETVFECVQTIYDSGARAFLFIDVPPIERAPLIVKGSY